MSFSYVENNNSAKIKVIGVGGAGGNAVNNMIDAKLQGVKFIVANTDVQALEASRAEVKIQIGKELTEGLGAGADPNKGHEAALESMDELQVTSLNIKPGKLLIYVAVEVPVNNRDPFTQRFIHCSSPCFH